MSLSGTFFCEMTTAQSLPRTPTEVMFAAVMALNAYSVECESGNAPFRCARVRYAPTW